jgi:hypothetical protein
MAWYREEKAPTADGQRPSLSGSPGTTSRTNAAQVSLLFVEIKKEKKKNA